MAGVRAVEPRLIWIKSFLARFADIVEGRAIATPTDDF